MRFAACWTRSPRSAARSSRPSCLRRADRPRSSQPCSVASLLAGVVVVALPYDAPPRAETARGGGREMLQGFTAIAADRRLGLITVLGVVQTFTRGCLAVFVVVVAIDLLDMGNPGVGVLNAAV